MSRITLDGPDGRGGYLVSLDDIQGLVPADLVSDQTGSNAAADAEEWLAAESHAIADALTALDKGETPRAPFDRIRLTRDTP